MGAETRLLFRCFRGVSPVTGTLPNFGYVARVLPPLTPQKTAEERRFRGRMNILTFRELDRFTVLANQLTQEEPEAPDVPIPFHARNTGGYYVCRHCGKPFVDVASIRRHQAQYCRRIQR
jgi:hypothetical protein